MKPLILVTNDDGIQSDGLAALVHALQAVGEVIVSAPARQQSAVSHAISLAKPLRVTSVRPNWHAVSGTPVDSVFVALFELCPRRPDLVVSGINHGANLGSDVFYSGTVAGALEGALRGIPAIAVSQQLPDNGNFPPEQREEAQKATGVDPLQHLSGKLNELLHRTASFTALFAQALQKQPEIWRNANAFNINAPLALTQSYRWTFVGKRRYRGQVVRRVDPRGIPYYWIAGPQEPADEEVGSDSGAVDSGVISVSPLELNWSPKVDRHQLSLTIEGYEPCRL